MEKLDQELKREYVNIVRKSLSGMSLDRREISMLFFWVRHSDDPELSFIKSELNLGDDLLPKKPKKRRYFRRRRQCSQAGSEKSEK